MMISAHALMAIPQQERPKIVDATWFLDPARSGRDAYLEEHIPGAVFFDLDQVADRTISQPHMLPPPDVFAEAVGSMGISHDDDLVIYDAAGLFSAPRVWWTFKVMGAARAKVLDGGLPAWKDAGGETVSEGTQIDAAIFKPSFDDSAVVSHDEMRRIVADQGAVILDARPAARFAGEAPEPREGLRCGHMPGAVNVPLSQLLVDGRLKSRGALREVFEAAGVRFEEPVVTTCGSGVTAAVLSLGLTVAGYEKVRLYDGSWAEWGADPAVPVLP